MCYYSAVIKQVASNSYREQGSGTEVRGAWIPYYKINSHDIK